MERRNERWLPPARETRGRLRVEPGCTAQVWTAMPQIPVQPLQAVVCADGSLDWLTVCDFQIGRNSQFASAGEVDARAFSMHRLHCDRMVPGIDANVTVRLSPTAPSSLIVSLNLLVQAVFREHEESAYVSESFAECGRAGSAPVPAEDKPQLPPPPKQGFEFL